MQRWKVIVAVGLMLSGDCGVRPGSTSLWGAAEYVRPDRNSGQEVPPPEEVAKHRAIHWLVPFLFGYLRGSGGRLPSSWDRLKAAMGVERYARVVGRPVDQVFELLPEDFKLKHGRLLCRVYLVQARPSEGACELGLGRYTILQVVDPASDIVYSFWVSEAQWQAALGAYRLGKVGEL